MGPAKEWQSAETVDGWMQLEQQNVNSLQMPGKILRLVTYNVHYGDKIDSIANDFINSPQLVKAEVILLQEIRSFPQEGQSRAARLAKKLRMNYVYAPSRPEMNGTHGLAILSVYDLKNVQVMELPRAQLIAGQRRIALKVDIATKQGLISIVNVHLDPCLNISERMFQLRPAVVNLPPPTIVAGDFNTNPFLWVFDAIPEVPIQVIGDTDQGPLLDDFMSKLGYTNATSALGATLKFWFISSRLDAVYLQNINAKEGNVEREINSSDHWPVWVDIELP